MSFGNLNETDEVMSEINMTPLVDVMLVLLIIFMITIPVMKHSVNVELPVASNTPQLLKPETVRLSVDADGVYYWNEQPVDDASLSARLIERAAQEPQPELHIQGDRSARYERVAQLMSAAQRAGLRKLGFVTEPAR